MGARELWRRIGIIVAAVLALAWLAQAAGPLSGVPAWVAPSSVLAIIFVLVLSFW